MPSAAQEALTDIRARIAQACKIARRDPAGVTLVAVSKTHGPDEIVPLLEAGHRVFGENRVQEAAAKWPALRAQFPDIELHMIGQLQSNKAAEAVALFDCIHSLDRPSLVTALGKAMAFTSNGAGRRVPCLVQVDIGEEPQKGGCAIAALPALMALARGAGIEPAGLMCVPPAGTEPAPFFALLDKLVRDCGLDETAAVASGRPTGWRSMGMSSDFETAIMLGATHVRVGSALFGPAAVSRA